MGSYNALKRKIITSGTADAVPLREDLNSRQLEEGMANQDFGGYNPYSRKRKNPNSPDNRNQFGDSDAESTALGPAAGPSGVGLDDDRGQTARDNYEHWFGGHENLWDRQRGNANYDSAPMMSGGATEPLIEGTIQQQADSPIGSAQAAFRKNDPRGDRDNSTPDKRLPNGNGIRPVSLKERNRKAVHAFNESRRQHGIDGPLSITWAYIKKGCVR